MFQKRGIALGFVMVASSFACGSSAETDDSAPTGADGFKRYAGLGESCRAAVAESPAGTYGSLSYVPCRSGEASCSELHWDGAVKWDPTDSGEDMLQFSLQPVFDSAGTLRRILVTHKYPVTDATDGVPFEAVAYDVATGAPLAAWRNTGDSSNRRGRSCAINVALGVDHALVLATPSASNDVLMLREPLQPGGSRQTFEPIAADRSVMQRSPLASSSTATFYEEGGRMWRVDLATGAVVSDSGPGQRLWPSLVAGDEVLARSASPTSDGYYWFKGPSNYVHIPVLAPLLLADAARLVWVKQTGGLVEVWSAPRTAPDASAAAKRVAEIAAVAEDVPLAAASIVAASIGNGTLAIQTEDPIRESSTLYLVALDSGSVRQRAVAGGAMTTRLLANSEKRAWLGYSTYAREEETQFDQIVMVDLSLTCTGTPSCAELSAEACSTAPGCRAFDTCSGTSSDPCTYPTEQTCFEHVCAWDALDDKCLPGSGCANATPAACANTAGCIYGACSPVILNCSELSPTQCNAQPGCKLSD